MGKELAKAYEPHEVEERIYEFWMNGKYFHAEVDSKKKPYTIVIPPPNITGQLHMGHALDETLQDILIRFRRMQGYSALWLPGTDHASIATEAKIVEAMKQEGVTKEDVGRDGFMKRAWEWKEKYGGTIISQLKKLGSSCDWDRERFTLDEGCSKAVKEVFVKLYNEGLIYRGERMINWCPNCKTSISDAEVDFAEKDGNFWHIRYPLADGSGYLNLATTRPETMLGDTAVAVHPEDERYQHLIGKMLILPLVGREIPIVADTYVEQDFGTGVVKITPAHDPNDFEVGLRHNLPVINIMDESGIINENGGEYQGMDRLDARKKIVKALEEQGYLIKVEPIKHNVGTCYRCKTVVEPRVSKQWFVKMEPLAKPAVKAVEDGEVKFVPERFDKIYFNWMNNIKDWCISRQLWWGHRIPAWYHKETGEIYVGMEDPKDIENWTQDEDVLDTWFSSALWPFSTLGWPNETDDLNRYFPNDLLVTGYDIIFFWVARMAFQTRYCMHNRPFKDVLIHGLVRDSQGRKMSKSLGNGIDPMDVIEKYGVDALRFFLTTNSTPGQDLRFIDTKVEASWNFINKIWNASRFTMMQVGDMTLEEVDLSNVNIIDKWILTRFNEVLENVTNNMDKYEFALVGNELYSFIWDDFCSWYIELSKAGLQSDDAQAVTAAKSTLITVLSGIIRMLEPFMPFVSEEIYLSMPHAYESINKEAWPEKAEITMSEEEMASVKQLITMIEAVRAIKVDYNLKPSMDINVMIKDEKETLMKPDAKINAILQKMCHASWTAQESSEEMVTRPILNGTLSVPLASIINVEEEIEKLSKELKRLTGEIKRGEGMLSNPNFVNKAPEAKVNAEKEKLEGYRSQYAIVEKQLEEMKKKA